MPTKTKTKPAPKKTPAKDAAALVLAQQARAMNALRPILKPLTDAERAQLGKLCSERKTDVETLVLNLLRGALRTTSSASAGELVRRRLMDPTMCRTYAPVLHAELSKVFDAKLCVFRADWASLNYDTRAIEVHNAHPGNRARTVFFDLRTPAEWLTEGGQLTLLSVQSCLMGFARVVA